VPAADRVPAADCALARLHRIVQLGNRGPRKERVLSFGVSQDALEWITSLAEELEAKAADDTTTMPPVPSSLRAVASSGETASKGAGVPAIDDPGALGLTAGAAGGLASTTAAGGGGAGGKAAPTPAGDPGKLVPTPASAAAAGGAAATAATPTAGGGGRTWQRWRWSWR